MAKGKSKQRSVSSANPRSYSEYFRKEAGSLDEPRPAAQSKSVKQPEPSVDRTLNWSSEYGQIFSDLRQLLLISAVLFVAMIVLGMMI